MQQTPVPGQESRKSTFREDLRDIFMNTQSLFSISKTLPPRLQSETDSIYILGQKFSLEQEKDPRTVNKIIEKALSDIIWFSYRRNFPILRPKTEKTYISDTGWGCSIRVGQMMFAEALRRHFGNSKKLAFTVSLFSDCELDPEIAPFGIQQITPASAHVFKLQPGDWFKFTHVILIFEELCHNFAQKILPDLEFMLFSDGIIFINQIYEKVSGYSGCLLCREAAFDNKFRDKLCENCRKFQKSLFLTICLMPSPTHLRVEDMDCIYELLSSRFSVGMMGGKPGRAKFFVGAKEKDFLCKDPHYVQDAVIGFDDLSSFFCHEIKYVDVRKMSSSLAFGFYLKDEREFEEFEGFLRKGKEKLGEKWLLGFEEEFYQEKEFQEMMMQEEEEEKKGDEREEIEEKEDGNLIILERKKSKGKKECLVTN